MECIHRQDQKHLVLSANLELPKLGLVLYTWGNVSQIDRASGEVIIKPSGVSYQDMSCEDMVVVNMQGDILEGKYKPSSDLMTHLVLYRSFPEIGGIVHTHSTYATAWAQSGFEIPCLGTTHADYFYGSIPITRPMKRVEIEQDYEANTGKVIVERFKKLNPLHIPGVLVANHGPFTWGKDAMEAVHNAAVLEEIARIAMHTLSVQAAHPANSASISKDLLDKHFLRKHGANAYYGQVTL